MHEHSTKNCTIMLKWNVAERTEGWGSLRNLESPIFTVTASRDVHSGLYQDVLHIKDMFRRVKIIFSPLPVSPKVSSIMTGIFVRCNVQYCQANLQFSSSRRTASVSILKICKSEAQPQLFRGYPRVPLVRE